MVQSLPLSSRSASSREQEKERAGEAEKESLLADLAGLICASARTIANAKDTIVAVVQVVVLTCVAVVVVAFVAVAIGPRTKPAQTRLTDNL